MVKPNGLVAWLFANCQDLQEQKGAVQDSSIDSNSAGPALPAAQVADCPYIRVWVIDGTRDETALARAPSILSRDDWVAVRAYRSPAQRRRLLASKALLRLALSHESKNAIDASTWRFDRTHAGKPIVAQGMPQLHFSVSHSDSGSAVAVSRNSPVGVDIEALDEPLDDGTVATFTSPAEWHWLQSLPEQQRLDSALTIWTLKEAYTKLVGLGVDLDFRSLSFDLASLCLRGNSGANFNSVSCCLSGRGNRVSIAYRPHNLSRRPEAAPAAMESRI